MYNLLKEKLNSLFVKSNRSASVEVTSKTKFTTPRKASLDMGSKAKDAQVTAKKECFHVVFNDKTSKKTAKKSQEHLQDKGRHPEIISDKIENQIEIEILNPESQGLKLEEKIETPSISKDQKLLDSQEDFVFSNNNQNIFLTEKKDLVQVGAVKIPEPNLQLSEKRQLKPIKARKLCFQCAQCCQRVKLEESAQLACTHRIHKGCVPSMNCRNKYTCKICERLMRLKRRGKL